MPQGLGAGSRLYALPKFVRANEAGADQFALAPHHRTNPKHLAALREGEPEHFRYRQRPNVQANALVADIDDQAFDPRRLGRGDQKPTFVQLDPGMLPLSEVIAISRRPILQSFAPGEQERIVWAENLKRSYRVIRSLAVRRVAEN
jgi:hypothetical protein